MTVQIVAKAVIDAITAMLTGIGSAIVEFFDAVFLDSTGEGLSTFAIVALCMVGLGVGTSLVYGLLNKVRGS